MTQSLKRTATQTVPKISGDDDGTFDDSPKKTEVIKTFFWHQCSRDVFFFVFLGYSYFVVVVVVVVIFVVVVLILQPVVGNVVVARCKDFSTDWSVNGPRRLWRRPTAQTERGRAWWDVRGERDLGSETDEKRSLVVWFLRRAFRRRYMRYVSSQEVFFGGMNFAMLPSWWWDYNKEL